MPAPRVRPASPRCSPPRRRVARLAMVAVLAAGLGPAGRTQPDAVGRADGLPSDYVLAVTQDRNGFVWFGTDAGVARWDGAQAVAFTTDDGLPHAYVYALAQDGAGTLWAGTRRGLARRDGRRFRAVATPFGETSVDRLFADARGRLVVTTARGVARREADGRWRAWRGPTLASAPLADGRVLVSTSHPGRPPAFWALPAESGRPTRVRAPRDLSVRVWPAPRGGVLVATPGGIGSARLDGDRLRLEGPPVPVGAEGVSSALAARDGRFYVGGYTGGLLRAAPGEPVARLLLSDRIEALAEDYEGGVWVGTFGDGAVRLRADAPVTLWPASVLRLARAGDDVWATSDRLLRIRLPTLAVQPAFPMPLLRAVTADADGRVRVSAATKLFAPVAPTDRAPPDDGYDATWFSGLAAAHDTLWAGTYGRGLLRFALQPGGRAGRALDTLRLGHGLPTDVVEDVLPAAGGVWLLTREAGAVRVRGRHVAPLGRAQGLPSSAAFCVMEDTDGTVWVGTDRGIARVRGRRVTTFGGRALTGQRIVALFRRPSAPGAVWAVADRALVRLDRTGVHVLGSTALVPDARTTVNAALYDADRDRLLLATTRGLVAVNLQAVANAAPRPRVALVGARTDDHEADLAGTPTAGRLADLAPGRHRVEVDVAPLSFAGPPRVEVRWDGGPWRAVPGRTVAQAGVGAGAHRLDVRAVSADGRLSAHPATLAFRVRPFWWERRTVQVGLGLLLAAGLMLAGQQVGRRRLRARLTALEAERAAERRVLAERARISRDLHDTVGSGLASVVASVEAVRLEREARGDPSGPLRRVEDAARETLVHLRESVWALSPGPLTASRLAAQIQRMAAFRTAAAGLTLTVEVDGDAEAPVAPEPALHLARIALEAVANAAAHSGGTAVCVRLGVEPDGLTLAVADDGAFAGPGDGAGLGLASMRARAEALGGTFELHGTDDGTTVRVRLPRAESPGRGS